LTDRLIEQRTFMSQHPARCRLNLFLLTTLLPRDVTRYVVLQVLTTKDAYRAT